VKKLVTLLVAVLAITALPGARAEAPLFTAYSPDNSTYPTNLNAQHRLFIIAVSILDTNPSELILRAGFKSNLNNTSFSNSGYGRPQLRFVISNFPFSQRADVGDFWIEAPNDQNYDGSTHIVASASTYTNATLGPSGGRKSLSECKPETWLEPGAQTSAVVFKIDRVCAEIPNIFYVNAYIDSDSYNSSTVNDWKFATPNPTYIDLSRVPRPPKMINQKVSFDETFYTQNLDNPILKTTLSTSMGLPVTVTSLTPSICLTAVEGRNLTVNLLKSGVCTIEAFAAGNSAVSPSPRVQQSFTVNPKVMIYQELKWNRPDAVKVGDEPFDLRFISTAGLPVTVTSDSRSICQFNDPTRPSWVTIVGSGTCYVTVRAAASDKYFEASGTASFWVDRKPVVTPTKAPSPNPSATRKPTPTPSPTRTTTISITSSVTKDEEVNTRTNKGDLSNNSKKEITIYCKKGSKTTPVKAVNPKCPTGSTKVKKP
jgi:hypothetical protein